MQKQKIYSYHIFSFPFKWKKWNTDFEAPLKEMFDISIFDIIEKNGKWERKSFKFKLDQFDKYNEYNYFYEYVREIMYDLDNELITNRTKNNHKLIHHYEYDIQDDYFYNIKLKDNEYHLNIETIILNVYSTGTAILSFHLRNHLYHETNDILAINKYGRRLYVPFFSLKPDSVYDGKGDISFCNKEHDYFEYTKNKEIPEAIWIGKKELKKESNNQLYEDFEENLIFEKEHKPNKNDKRFKNGPFFLPKFIKNLFPENFLFEHEKDGLKDGNKFIKNKEKYSIYVRPVLDDRMHIVSWYGNTEIMNTLNEIKGNYYSFEKSDFWYSYIYVDTSPTHTNRFEKQKLLHNQTYSRWVEEGTLYGMSRYSLVMLTKNFDTTQPYLVKHLQSIYYKMAELCLLQRATVLSFSDEVVHVSNLINAEKEQKLEKTIERIDSLYKHYILFVNKIYFREITAQEQGIEMYDLMQQTMRIPQDVKDLDNELDELNRYASMISDKQANKESKKLSSEAHYFSKIATFLLIPTFIAGVLGINLLPEKWVLSKIPYWPFWLSMILIGFGFIIANRLLKSKNKKE